jgi:hypothetical protein
VAASALLAIVVGLVVFAVAVTLLSLWCERRARRRHVRGLALRLVAKPVAPTPSYTFQYHRSRADGLWYGRCVHRNGRVVEDFAEGYKRKGALLAALEHRLGAIKRGDYQTLETPQ